MTSKFLQAIRPFMSITPEVVKPPREVHFNEKVLWTIAALIIYFVMASTPIYGAKLQGGDPYSYMRMITASTRGSLADLGIGPIVTAGLIMQILTGSKIIAVNMGDPEERALYTGAQKVLSLIMTFIEATAFLIGENYGPLDELLLTGQLVIITQLLVAGIIIILLDEMIQKGWGLGSGISLFIAGGVGLQIFQGLFAWQPVFEGPPLSTDQNYTVESARGIVLAFYAWTTQQDLFSALGHLFFRYSPNPRDQLNLPSLSILSVLATIVVFIIVVYFESMRIEIPISYAEYKGIRSNYPIKLLYVSNIPVILTSAVFADIYFIAQMVWNASGGEGTSNPLALFLGTFRIDEATQQHVPRSGLVYFMTPPQSFVGEIGFINLANPIESVLRALVYAVFLITLCIIFAAMWLETAGMGSSDVARQLLQSGMQIPGWRRSKKIVERRLEMYIPTIAVIGGFFIGALAAFADFFGAIGSGMGILLSVSIMRQYLDLISKEKIAEMNPTLRNFLGI